MEEESKTEAMCVKTRTILCKLRLKFGGLKVYDCVHEKYFSETQSQHGKEKGQELQ